MPLVLWGDKRILSNWNGTRGMFTFVVKNRALRFFAFLLKNVLKSGRMLRTIVLQVTKYVWFLLVYIDWSLTLFTAWRHEVSHCNVRGCQNQPWLYQPIYFGSSWGFVFMHLPNPCWESSASYHDWVPASHGGFQGMTRDPKTVAYRRLQLSLSHIHSSWRRVSDRPFLLRHENWSEAEWNHHQWWYTHGPLPNPFQIGHTSQLPISYCHRWWTYISTSYGAEHMLCLDSSWTSSGSIPWTNWHICIRAPDIQQHALEQSQTDTRCQVDLGYIVAMCCPDSKFTLQLAKLNQFRTYWWPIYCEVLHGCTISSIYSR